METRNLVNSVFIQLVWQYKNYETTKLYEEIDRMLELDDIAPSSSPWSSPMRLVVKPNKVRLCLYARKLNDATKKGCISFTKHRRYIFSTSEGQHYYKTRPQTRLLAN